MVDTSTGCTWVFRDNTTLSEWQFLGTDIGSEMEQARCAVILEDIQKAQMPKAPQEKAK